MRAGRRPRRASRLFRKKFPGRAPEVTPRRHGRHDSPYRGGRGGILRHALARRPGPCGRRGPARRRRASSFGCHADGRWDRPARHKASRLNRARNGERASADRARDARTGRRSSGGPGHAGAWTPIRAPGRTARGRRPDRPRQPSGAWTRSRRDKSSFPTPWTEGNAPGTLPRGACRRGTLGGPVARGDVRASTLAGAPSRVGGRREGTRKPGRDRLWGLPPRRACDVPSLRSASTSSSGADVAPACLRLSDRPSRLATSGSTKVAPGALIARRIRS